MGIAMRIFVGILVACTVAMTACSSKKKSTEAQEPVIEQKSTNKAIEKIEKKKAKKAAQEATAKAPALESSPSPAPTSSGGSFDTYAGTEKSSHTCVSKGDSRKISVLSGADGGCGVVYNKMNEAKTVAVAKVDANHCDTVANKIKSNLEAAGFDCGGGSAQPTAQPSATPQGQPTN